MTEYREYIRPPPEEDTKEKEESESTENEPDNSSESAETTDETEEDQTEKGTRFLFHTNAQMTANMLFMAHIKTKIIENSFLTQFYVDLVAVDFFLVAHQKMLFDNLLINKDSY